MMFKVLSQMMQIAGVVKTMGISKNFGVWLKKIESNMCPELKQIDVYR